LRSLHSAPPARYIGHRYLYRGGQTKCGLTSCMHYGQLKQVWLAAFLDLLGGIPSHDTFGQVFSLLDPQQVERCFHQWRPPLPCEVITIDSKRLSGACLTARPGLTARNRFPLLTYRIQNDLSNHALNLRRLYILSIRPFCLRYPG
jgi:hypothetical protein